MSTLHLASALARSPMVNNNGHMVTNRTPLQPLQPLHHVRNDSIGLNGKSTAPLSAAIAIPTASATAPVNSIAIPTSSVATPGPTAVGVVSQPLQLNEIAVAADSAYQTSVNAMADTWLAIASCCETFGDADKAVASYDKVLKLVPNSAPALTKLGNLYRHRDMFPQAAEFYQRALTTDNTNGETWGLLGHCYLMLDDLQRAYAAYQQALFHLSNPNVPKLWHGIGILYDRYGSLEFAEEAFAKVLMLDPEFEKATEIYFRLGIIYKQQHKFTESLDCFKYILHNPPSPLTQPDVWFQIGSVLEQQRDFNGAKDAYERVLTSNPRHSKVLQLLGCLYSQQSANFHNLDKALALLTQSLELDQEDAHTWYHLGRVYMAKGDYNEAYESFQHAVNKDSRNPTFWCSIGVLYYQISQYRDALNAYTRAIRLNPYISEVWYDLGTLYETCNNQLSDALDAYHHAQRLDPSNPHIKARLEQLTRYQQEGGTSSLPPPSQELRLPQGMIPNVQDPEMQQQQQLPQLRMSENQAQAQVPSQTKLNIPHVTPSQEYNQTYYLKQHQPQVPLQNPAPLAALNPHHSENGQSNSLSSYLTAQPSQLSQHDQPSNHYYPSEQYPSYNKPSVASIVSSPEPQAAAQHAEPYNPAPPLPQQRAYPDILNGNKPAEPETPAEPEKPVVPIKREASELSKPRPKKRHTAKKSQSPPSSEEKTNGSSKESTKAKLSTPKPVSTAKPEIAPPTNQNSDLKLPDARPTEEDDDGDDVVDEKEAKEVAPIRQIDEDEDYDEDDEEKKENKSKEEIKLNKEPKATESLIDTSLQNAEKSEKSDQKPDEKSEQISEKKPDEKSDDKPDEKSDEKPDQNPDQKPDENPDEKSDDDKVSKPTEISKSDESDKSSITEKKEESVNPVNGASTGGSVRGSMTPVTSEPEPIVEDEKIDQKEPEKKVTSPKEEDKETTTEEAKLEKANDLAKEKVSSEEAQDANGDVEMKE